MIDILNEDDLQWGPVKCRLQLVYPFSLNQQANFKGKSTSTMNF